MSDSLIGKQLGDYLIRELLGRGGMARVYIGYDARLDRQAAVKVINSDFSPADRAEYFERFQREARAIARLNHPNIVGVYQFGQYEDSYYMAMVFVEGRDLRQILREYNDRREMMPTADVLNVARGIGSALDYAHSRGVIHRDVKPSNIMLTKEGNRSILTDFGLALSTSEGTRGETFGSAHYIAPEQAISSAKAVPQSDLYSLGICLYEMLTGKVPFDDPSAMTVALKHLQDPPPLPRTINPALSPALEHVLLRALDKDPARRYPSGAELSRALESAFDNQTLPDTAQIQVDRLRAELRVQAGPSPVPPTEQVAVPAPSAAPTQPEGLEATPLFPPAGLRRDAVLSVPAPMPTVPTASGVRTDVFGSGSAPKSPLDTGAAPIHPPPTAARRTVWLFGLLAAVALIAVLGGGLLVAKQAGLFASASATVKPTTSATPTVATPDLSATAAGAFASASISPAGTQPATANATSSAGVVALNPSETGTAAATVAATPTPSTTTVVTLTETPTAALTDTLTATATATVAASQTASPTLSPTDLLSATASPTLMATSSPTAVISATPEAGTGAGTVTNTASATVENADVRLLYNADQLVAINIAKHQLSLRGVTFVQTGPTGPSGTVHSFDALDWIKKAPFENLAEGECFQIVRPGYGFAQAPQPLSPCDQNHRMAYDVLVGDLHYFWSTATQTSTTVPSVTFNVLFNNRLVAICAYGDGECRFSLSG